MIVIDFRYIVCRYCYLIIDILYRQSVFDCIYTFFRLFIFSKAMVNGMKFAIYLYGNRKGKDDTMFLYKQYLLYKDRGGVAQGHARVRMTT